MSDETKTETWFWVYFGPKPFVDKVQIVSSTPKTVVRVSRLGGQGEIQERLLRENRQAGYYPSYSEAIEAIKKRQATAVEMAKEALAKALADSGELDEWLAEHPTEDTI